MAASDAKFYPIKNAAYRWYFVLRDADGDPVTSGAFDSGLGSGSGKAALSKDGASAVNSTNSITEVAVGFYYLDLTSSEMNYDCVLVMAVTTTSGAKSPSAILHTNGQNQVFVSPSTDWETAAPVKSLGAAVMKAVHRVRNNGGTLETYRADGTTIHEQQTLTGDASQVPLKEQTGSVAP